MIPKNISRNHILQAIKMVDDFGVPDGRESTRYTLIYQGKTYPPKYIIALANKIVNGEMLKSSIFSGGVESNSFLERLGFNIHGKSPTEHISKPPQINPRIQTNIKHSERCPECKLAIEKMLKKIYGDVICNYKFDLGTHPGDFIGSDYFQVLNEIFLSLQKYRGNDNFTRATDLPRVDFFIPDPGFILEFDEAQHFTSCRKQALLRYPDIVTTGFEKGRWIELCDKINAKDNNPIYRDEQRAWYDTVRDFLPSIKKINSTIRLYSKDFQWCTLNPEFPSDIQKFKSLLKNEKAFRNIGSKEIIVKEDINPTLARIVISGDWEGKVETSKIILEKICNNWPHSKKVDCLVTCGAFLSFDWPQSLTNIGDNKNPKKGAIDLLTTLAIKQCKALIDENLRKKLINFTDYLTIGIDSYKEKVTLNDVSVKEPHVELVLLIDLKNNKCFATGKSYPTPAQENGLVRVNDLDSHIVNLTMGKVLILGCHDLNVFSPRGKATTKRYWRRQVREGFYRIIKSEKPTLILHHPHTTDSSKTWTPAWTELLKLDPFITRYISAGRYFNKEKTRSGLDEVLAKTKLGDTIDFIVNN